MFSAGTVAVTGGLLAERMSSARLLTVALAHGLAYLIFVAATQPISGGHLNPAVTLAAFMSRQVGAARAFLYVVAQCAGAVAGALLLMVMIPASMAGLPTLNVPVGFSETGLPMGMQIIGRRGADLEVLRIGETWHRATDWPARRPPALDAGRQDESFNTRMS